MSATGKGYALRQLDISGDEVPVMRSLPVCGEDSA